MFPPIRKDADRIVARRTYRIVRPMRLAGRGAAVGGCPSQLSPRRFPMAGMVPEDVYELRGVADPRLSPDGRTVAFVVGRIDREANEYRGNIWLAPADGSAPPRQLTFGGRRDADPRWSPDGASLAFTSNRIGDAMQLYVIAVSGGGEARKITDLKEDVKHAAWSPDGSRIAFDSRVRADHYDEEDEKKRPPRRITRLFYKLDNEGWT